MRRLRGRGSGQHKAGGCARLLFCFLEKEWRRDGCIRECDRSDCVLMSFEPVLICLQDLCRDLCSFMVR